MLHFQWTVIAYFRIRAACPDNFGCFPLGTGVPANAFDKTWPCTFCLPRAFPNMLWAGDHHLHMKEQANPFSVCESGHLTLLLPACSLWEPKNHNERMRSTQLINGSLLNMNLASDRFFQIDIIKLVGSLQTTYINLKAPPFCSTLPQRHFAPNATDLNLQLSDAPLPVPQVC